MTGEVEALALYAGQSVGTDLTSPVGTGHRQERGGGSGPHLRAVSAIPSSRQRFSLEAVPRLCRNSNQFSLLHRITTKLAGRGIDEHIVEVGRQSDVAAVAQY